MSIHPGPPRKRGRRGHVVRWRDLEKRNCQATFDRREDAESFNDLVKRQRQLGPAAAAQLTSKAHTLDRWRAERWAVDRGPSLQDSTIRAYDRVWVRHVAGRLGPLKLAAIKPELVLDWQRQLARDGVGVETIRKARTALGSVLTHAVESSAIPSSPLLVIKAPRREPPRAVRPLAPETVERVRLELLQMAGRPERRLRYAEGLRDAAMVSLLAYAGLRPGELRALRWEDVRERTLLVDRAVDDAGKIKRTKTEKVGTVRLLAPLRAELTALEAAVRPAPSDLLLGSLWDKRDWERWRNRRWKKAVTAALGKGHRPRPYDLRHGFASLLIAEGRTTPYVAKQMRHTAEMTLRVYGHLFDEYEDAPAIVADDEITKWRAACTS